MFSTANLQTVSWTKELLLQHVTQEQVFEKLGCPVEEIGMRFCSPFRIDSHPDCKLFYTEKGVLRFYDPAAGLSMDWVAAVMYSQSLEYVEALSWIATQFGLAPGCQPTEEAKQAIAVAVARKVKQSTATIQVRSCPMSKKDLAWWGQYNIDAELLFRNRVWAISDCWVNGRHQYCPKGQLAFCYKEDDGYKLYFPEAEKKWKWRSTTKAISCYEQLPQTGELLVITSSKKDALCLMSFGYHAIAPQGEGMDLPTYLLWELKQRFVRVVIFYDNDHVGLKLAHDKWVKWQVNDYVFLPFEEPAKDPSDYCLQHGAVAAGTIFQTLLTYAR